MYPFALAAGAMTLYLTVAALQRPRPVGIFAAVLWGAYAVYEVYVANGTLCDANCNIRVDLLLFLPLLGWAATLALQKEPRRGAVTSLYVICLGVAALLSAAFGYTALAVIAAAGALGAAVYGIRSSLSVKRA